MAWTPETESAIAPEVMVTDTPCRYARVKHLGAALKVKPTFSSWQGLRLKWAFATKGLSYSSSIFERIYKIYLNHNKVIHFRDGYPVYSLTTPAAFSKPAANFVARALYRTIQNKNLPNVISFAVTDICNASCGYCSFYEGVDDPTQTLLTFEQCKKVIRDAQELGVSVVNFVGGEPLMRNDLPELINAVNKDLSTTVLFTNGWLLEKRVDSLRQAGLDSVYISLDAAEPQTHDRIRGISGLYGRAIRGIARAKALGLSTGISYFVTPEAFARGDLKTIIELGKEIGIHEVFVFDAMPTGRCKNRIDLVDNPGWVEEMILSANCYNESSAYPGVLFFSYMTSHRSVGCSCGTSYFYVSPYGDVMSCDFNHAIFGNVLASPLYAIWDSMSSDPDFQQAKWGGCKIKSGSSRVKETVSPERTPRPRLS